MRTNGDSHSYPQFPLYPQWGQYCTLRGCNLNRRRVIQCYTVTLWDFIVVVQYSLMAMLADERYIGEEKTIKIKKDEIVHWKELKTQLEQVNPVEICDSYSILSLLALTKKGSTCWPHTHADIHSHTSTLQSSILLCLFWKRDRKKIINSNHRSKDK